MVDCIAESESLDGRYRRNIAAQGTILDSLAQSAPESQSSVSFIAAIRGEVQRQMTDTAESTSSPSSSSSSSQLPSSCTPFDHEFSLVPLYYGVSADPDGSDNWLATCVNGVNLGVFSDIITAALVVDLENSKVGGVQNFPMFPNTVKHCIVDEYRKRRTHQQCSEQHQSLVASSGNTIGPWTAEEDTALLCVTGPLQDQRGNNGPIQWASLTAGLAKVLPQRTVSQCQSR